jgi:hypothetical protein
MEYVSGETLSAILNRHPRGLPQELILQWFPALCRAVGYLHDHGIVHRDLKPANIFLEAGLLKVGDYGLSKSMSSSHRSAQTQSVGTVHYMAPEISSGNYNKSIDIYALGVILYEMLTGTPPFDGESAQEIMMKHLMSLPDLGKVPAPFKTVVAKALAKDPNHRHTTAPELAKDVELVFSDLPVALPADSPRPVGTAKEIPVTAKPAEARAIPVVTPVKNVPAMALPALSVRDKVAELAGSLAMSAVFAGMTTALLSALRFTDNWNSIGTLFFMTVGVCWAVLIPSKFWAGKPGDEWMRRIVLIFSGALVGLLALWLDGWTVQGNAFHLLASSDSLAHSTLGLNTGAAYISYFGLALGLLRWWKFSDRRRDSWFSFFPVLSTGIFALLLLLVYPDWERPYGAAAVIISSMIVQWVSPWQAPPPAAPRRMRLRR